MENEKKIIADKFKNIKKHKNLIIGFSIAFVVISTLVLIGIFNMKKAVDLEIKYLDGNGDIINKIEKTILKENKNIKKPESVVASVPIFMYHFVREDTGDYEYPENMVRPSSLREQLKYLKENGYETIIMSDLENLESFSKPVGLTFDDGWQDFYQNAYPLFKENNMRASLFVITDLIGKPGYCTLEELKQMRDSGLIDIQSHTVTHPKLATLSNDKINKELNESKKYLKENLDIDSNIICYPYGSFNDIVVNESKNAGYAIGLAMDGGVYSTTEFKNIYKIPRIYANRSMSLNRFIENVKKSNVKVKW